MDLDHKIVCKLFNFTKSTFYNWKKENRQVIKLLEKYFTDNDLEEFIKTGEIKLFDIQNNVKYEANHISDKFFREHYSQKIKHTEFIEFIFPKFKKYINEHKLKIKSDNIKSELIECIIELNIDSINKYQQSYNGYASVNSFKSSVIGILSKLPNLELYLLFNTYEQYILEHKESFKDITYIFN